MAEAEDQAEEAELPLESVGARLARAREAAGLSRAAIAARTRIGERQLAAIEAGDFAALPGRTYAVGFSRTYARALGLDEKAIVQAVREELADSEPARVSHGITQFEPGDPARVPSSRLAWLSALVAAVIVIAGLGWWGSQFMAGGTLPSLLPEETSAPAPAAGASGAPAPQPGGAVVFTAQRDLVWVKFTDAGGNQLLQKELVMGESYALPGSGDGILLTTARPDALTITVDGKPVPRLSDVQRTMRDVPVSAAALLGRQAPAADQAPTPTSQQSRPRPQRQTRDQDGGGALPSAAPAQPPDPAPVASSPAAT